MLGKMANSDKNRKTLDKNAKIYVAGHRGLVGSAIWNNLLSRGYTNLLGRTHAELDLMDAAAVREFFGSESPDAVVLAAAHVGGIMANNTYRADFIYDNLQIQQNVIGESFRHGVQKLLFLGSTCIYPRDAAQPMREDTLLTSTLEYTNEPYAIAKIAGLKLCESLNLQYGTNYMAVMPTNLYGPNDNFDLNRSHVLPAMMRKMHLAKCLRNGDADALRRDLAARPVPYPAVPGHPAVPSHPEPVPGHPELGSGSVILSEAKDLLAPYGITAEAVTLWGSGTPMREFLWSEDMADASVHVLLNVDFKDVAAQSTENAAVGTSYGRSEIRNCHINIGTGREISIRELAEKIKAVVGYEGNILWDDSKPDGTMRKLTDVSRLHALGWTHKVEIDEGLTRLYRWYTDSQKD